jgi:hypothetical protein
MPNNSREIIPEGQKLPSSLGLQENKQKWINVIA